MSETPRHAGPLRPLWITRLLRPARIIGLRRTKPVSEIWGYDRGEPVDRYYIERFLAYNAKLIRGQVLEVKDSRYTERFGTGVTGRDVLDIDPKNKRATYLADLAAADAIPSNQFDCCIVTQTLQYIFEVDRAIAHLHRLLRPGGSLLITVPAVSRMDVDAFEGDYWRFTPASCSRLFGTVFGSDSVVVESFGNALTAMASLTGMAQEDLSASDLETVDTRFPLIVTVVATKAANEQTHGQ